MYDLNYLRVMESDGENRLTRELVSTCREYKSRKQLFSMMYSLDDRACTLKHYIGYRIQLNCEQMPNKKHETAVFYAVSFG